MAFRQGASHAATDRTTWRQTRDSSAMTRWRTFAASLAVTVLVGVAHPGSVSFVQAQATTPAFDLIGDQTPVAVGGLPTHDPTVGRLAGEAGVSGGSATYEIPIVVPPGRRGVQPSLALAYSSRSGNGIAGMGWALTGLSSLDRCPQTLEQDGRSRAVQLDAQDKLCLDGQRLVATSGTYGAASATYGTELESFARVTQLGGDLRRRPPTSRSSASPAKSRGTGIPAPRPRLRA